MAGKQLLDQHRASYTGCCSLGSLLAWGINSRVWLTLSGGRLSITRVQQVSIFFESNDVPVAVLEIATTKLAELIEQLAEVDDEIVEHVLNDTLRSNAQLAAAIGSNQP
ncbi:hypothetical protein BJV78DRAFT_186925 [Lactifluus subvellereus]|nr:hypothetical protein BJV78DRAFT_186925 [Lactifluus subvellereus]